MNTVIFSNDDAHGPILSSDCWGYAISKSVDSIDDAVFYNLHACPIDKDKKIIILNTFSGDKAREEALFTLDELLQAVHRGDRVFDVMDF